LTESPTIKSLQHVADVVIPKKIAVPQIKPATTHAETGEDEEQRDY
jgi:hypothetical protein